MKAVVRDHPLASFLVLTLALSGAVYAAGLGPGAEPFALVVMPTLAALATSGLADGRRGVRALLGRALRWRVDRRWYAAALLLPLGATLTIAVGAAAAGEVEKHLLDLRAADLLVPLVVLLPALLEELGWRGCAVPAAPHRSPLWRSVTIGAAFALVHLPLHLPGHLYEEVPAWPTPLTLVSYSILLTWIFLGTTGSVLLAGLTHAALNAAVPLTRGLDDVVVFELRALVFAALAGGVVLAVPWMRPRSGAGRAAPPRELRAPIEPR